MNRKIVNKINLYKEQAQQLPLQELSDKELADWCVNTCLIFGTSVHTAYLVAGEFVKGVRGDR